MRKGLLMLASFGLGLNLFLWGVPGMVAASSAAHFALPDISQARAAVDNGSDRSLYTALVKLIGAESEALRVASDGLHGPPPADLGPRADAAGADVEHAAVNYIRAVQAILPR